MNIAVTAAHRAFDRAEVRARNIEQRFAERGTSRLIANQRSKHIALFQKHSARGADCFLAAAEIHTADDHAAAIKASQFFLENTREEHPAKRLEVSIVNSGFFCRRF